MKGARPACWSMCQCPKLPAAAIFQVHLSQVLISEATVRSALCNTVHLTIACCYTEGS